MKAIKIDTIKKEIYEVNQHNIHDINKLIGCSCFCQVGRRLENGDILLVDDEGLFDKTKVAFKIGTYPQLLSGNGLLIGTNAMGETVEAKSDIQYLQSIVTFHDGSNLPKPSFEIIEFKDFDEFKKHFGK